MGAANTATVRDRARQLVLGAAGVRYPIAAGRFVLAHSAYEPLEHPLASLERAVFLKIDPSGVTPLEAPTRGQRGRLFESYPLVVQVGYVLTRAGEAPPLEADLPGAGAGDIEAIEDRAISDRTALVACLEAQANWGGLGAGPAVLDCVPTGASIDRAPDRVILAVNFSLVLSVPLAAA